MKKLSRLLVLLLVGGTLAFLFVWLLGPRYGVDMQAALRGVLLGEGEAARLTASGVIRAEAIKVSTLLGGRVKTIHVVAGEEVRSGQLLVELDTTLLDAQIAAAEAAVELARAGLRQAEAGARPGAIRIAEAQLAQAQTGVEVARQALADAEAYLKNPQLLELEASVAYAQVEGTQRRVNQASALRDAAAFAQSQFYETQAQLPFDIAVREGDLQDVIPPELAGVIPEEVWERGDGTYQINDLTIVIDGGHYRVTAHVDELPFGAHLTPNTYWQSWIGVNSAQAGLEGTQAYAWRAAQHANDPLEVRAQVETARAAVAETEAQAEMAQAYLDGLKAGATPEQIAAVQAQVERAEAALNRLLVQREQAAIYSPCECVVMEEVIHIGELAAPNAALLTLADLTEVQMAAYVQETDLGRVAVGQPVAVTLDAWPDRTFAGAVSRIAEQAEYTPRNVSTRDERVNLVFAVDIALDNPDGLLKPGMVGEVVLAP